MPHWWLSGSWSCGHVPVGLCVLHCHGPSVFPPSPECPGLQSYTRGVKDSVVTTQKPTLRSKGCWECIWKAALSHLLRVTLASALVIPPSGDSTNWLFAILAVWRLDPLARLRTTLRAIQATEVCIGWLRHHGDCMVFQLFLCPVLLLFSLSH